MKNIATHCDKCGEPLGANKYIVSPNGGVCQKKAWCQRCYESSVALATTERVSHYNARPTATWDEPNEYEDLDYETPLGD